MAAERQNVVDDVAGPAGHDGLLGDPDDRDRGLGGDPDRFALNKAVQHHVTQDEDAALRKLANQAAEAGEGEGAVGTAHISFSIIAI